jgi:hypothetical protein
MRSWRVLLLEHVTNYVMDSVCDLETFLQEAEEGLVWRTGENENGDSHNGREALLRMMGHLAEVRSRQSGTDALFAPLQEVGFLKHVLKGFNVLIILLIILRRLHC